MFSLTDFYLQVVLHSHVGHGSEPDYIVFDKLLLFQIMVLRAV
ncbi:hypothetical protein OIU80_20585 [Flavobacterium sp. LS1R47]|uniref:Uncharacterized protein n=1 Tax=Flavobacterium frigoritolerans TaxID=2987686 RepID=A0A9X3HNL9_9FLAO|nr:hypothetical protein [Flavobacterium frigoritolerans]MCV9934685.1 hypothetical protein [Flavobacterium frigoritolerans]